MISIISVTFVVLLSSLWALPLRHRHAQDIESLLAELTPGLRASITVQSSFDHTKQRLQDDATYMAVGGLGGMMRRYRNAGILLNIALRIEAEALKTDADCNIDICNRALILRISLAGCVLEHLLLRTFRTVPLPRIMVRNSIDQYDELCAFVWAIMEFHRPDLIDAFDAVS